MRLFKSISTLLACSLLCAGAAQAAQPVYKCRIDGTPSYSDRPCPDGQGQTMPPPALGLSAGGAAGATTDSRLLLELEKERTEQARQQAIAAKAQATAAREQRAQARAGHVEVKQVQHCDKLRLQHRWLQEDLAKARTPAQQDTARTKLKRQAESMAVECPA